MTGCTVCPLSQLDTLELDGKRDCYRCRCETFGGVAAPERAQPEMLLVFD